LSKKRAHANIVHWDDVEVQHWTAGHISADGRRLGAAAGSVGVGLSRIQIDPGRWSTPAHVHGREEEIFFVLGGSGLLWQDGANFDIAETDCFAFPGGVGPHTLKAGPEGLDVLAFSENIGDSAAFLPRSKVSWLGVSWVEAGAVDHPFALEAAQGPPDVKESSLLHPSNLARLRDVGAVGRSKKTIGRIRRDLGDAVGSRSSGLGHIAIAPGKLSCPPHCHSAEVQAEAGSRDRAPAGNRRRTRIPGGRERIDATCLWNSPLHRPLLLPALAQDLFPWSWRDRANLAGRLLGRRGVAAGAAWRRTKKLLLSTHFVLLAIASCQVLARLRRNCLESFVFPVPCELCRFSGGRRLGLGRDLREGLRLNRQKMERRWGSPAYCRVRSHGRLKKECRWGA
jgi:uncharacterized cupin superfamily protein